MKRAVQHAGFTLIEMLVVISILAVLATVFSYGMARLKTQSHVRAVGRMFQLVDEALREYRNARSDFPTTTSIEGLYRELVMVPEARAILEQADKNWGRQTPKITVPPSEDRSAWPPVADPWGRRFEYQWDFSAGDTFPLLRCSGPDGVLYTDDDILNR